MLANSDGDVCPPGYQYYSCESNGFTGCCAVNPCSLPGCPTSSALVPDRGQRGAVPVTSSDRATRTMSPASTTRTPPTTAPSGPSTKTDSGITHTIPNNSVVTVTRHTLVFSEAPLSTAASSAPSPSTGDAASFGAISSSASSCSTCSLTSTPTATGPSSADGSEEGGVPAGAIAGAGTGAAVIVAIALILVFVSRQRRRQRRRAGWDASEAETETLGGGGCEKSGWRAGQMACGRGGDPFAPFGGRADHPPDEPAPPPGDTYEMDGTGIPAVELPAVSRVSEAPGTAARRPSLGWVEVESEALKTAAGTRAAADPAATLAAPAGPRGRVTYVNQWNQYMAMAAAGEETSSERGEGVHGK